MAMLRTFAKDVMPALPGAGTMTAEAGATTAPKNGSPIPKEKWTPARARLGVASSARASIPVASVRFVMGREARSGRGCCGLGSRTLTASGQRGGGHSRETRSRDAAFGGDEEPVPWSGGVASARLLPAIAAGERVAGDALVSPDEHVPVNAASTEPEARCRGKRVRVHGVAVGRVRIAWSHNRSREEGGRPEGQASLGKGWSGERDEHEGPEADHEGFHRSSSNTEARRQLLCDP